MKVRANHFEFYRLFLRLNIIVSDLYRAECYFPFIEGILGLTLIFLFHYFQAFLVLNMQS